MKKTLALAACLASAAAVHAGIWINGVKLNGFTINGVKLNGAELAVPARAGSEPAFRLTGIVLPDAAE